MVWEYFFSIFNDGTTHSLSILRVYSVRHQQPIAISHSSCRIFKKHPEEISFYEMRKKKSEQNTFMHEVIWTCKWERYWRMAGDPVLESCCEWADKNKFLPIDKNWMAKGRFYRLFRTKYLHNQKLIILV